MDLGISGKNALVTGGANGIGEGISYFLAEAGVNITVTSRTKKSIENLKVLLSNFDIKVDGYVVDFLNEDSVKTLFSEMKSDGYKCDILINNAGHNLEITDPYCEISDWRRIMSLNFETAVRFSNYCIPYMKSVDWGRIVNITSCAGIENMGPVTYGVSKAALTSYTRTMGRILATEVNNVVMTAVFPGVIATKGGHWDKILQNNPKRAENYLKDRCPLGRFGEVKEIASVVAFYCSTHASFSHGAIVPADAGQARSYLSFNYM
jgi:NAD(P)-dependent dehydrogenase (short-subunit alcohol dehydrogenase family)